MFLLATRKKAIILFYLEAQEYKNRSVENLNPNYFFTADLDFIDRYKCKRKIL